MRVRLETPMLLVDRHALAGEAPNERLTLPFDMRRKSRLLARLDSGIEVNLILQRGRVLQSGDLLKARDGTIVEVCAAVEEVSTIRASNALVLTRAAYHLGNRHVPLQVGDGFLRYPRDHVLDEMIRQMGLDVVAEFAPFEPESGAYGGSHSHAAVSRTESHE